MMRGTQASDASPALRFPPTRRIRVLAVGQDGSWNAVSISLKAADMEVLLGFVIAIAISLTGVGAGSMTTPLLILLLGVPPATAVGTALSFGAIVKIASVPMYAFRNQVNLRILKLLLLGGLPGVLVGSLVLGWLKDSRYSGTLYVLLGYIIVSI